MDRDGFQEYKLNYELPHKGTGVSMRLEGAVTSVFCVAFFMRQVP